KFSERDQELVKTLIRADIVKSIPGLGMQGLLFGGILASILYLMVTRGDFERAVPTLTIFAFAGYRLMPALQSLYQSMSDMRFSDAALTSLCAEIRSVPHVSALEVAGGSSEGRPLKIRNGLSLEDVSYTYPEAAHPALRGLSIDIPVRSAIGLVGSTGSGKTTAIDVLLGLLRPEAGALSVDGTPLSDGDIREWQRVIGYVPQQIFLSDETIEGNIAFGVPSKSIDRAAVERAARAADLHDFIVTELPDGYDTTVGERGVRLSGGQRQRIGIARALYREPDLLILDEATSALDNLTEQSVMKAVRTLEGDKTIVLVAHRLSTVRTCDRIYMLNQGRVVASGTYDELIANSPEFRALAELA
ncbi:ABC-type multidrug transport system, ATP binding permease protein, partial [sediment metagenome]